MNKTDKTRENGNGKFLPEDSSQNIEAAVEEKDETLKKLLQRAVNRENVPENLERIIRQKIRR